MISSSSSTARARRAVFAVAGIALGGVVLAPAPASAYVRYLSDSACPYAWRTRTIAITAFPQGLSNDVTLQDITNGISRAVSAWSRSDPALSTCTDLDLQLTMRSLSEVPPASKYDHLNQIMFRDVWGCMPNSEGVSECRDQNALAITSVFATSWGQIVDADIEVNAVNFMWADLDTTPIGGGRQDIQNALTHEMGHFIGLDHTCYGDPRRARPHDQNDVAIPDCSAVSIGDPIHATTMFASADPGDLTKRSLEPDDQRGLCDIYPAGAASPNACPVPEQGGCAIGGQGSVGVASTVAPEASFTNWRSWVSAGTIVLGIAAIAGARRARRRRRANG